jgi:hypothetical protein
MVRIIIEIDGKEVSSTTVQPTGGVAAPPPELLVRATALGALNAGSAPSEIASLDTAVVPPAAIDAGPSREHAAASEHAGDPKHKNKPE